MMNDTNYKRMAFFAAFGILSVRNEIFGGVLKFLRDLKGIRSA